MDLYGECVCGSVHAPVTISRLGRHSCRVSTEQRAAALKGDLALWIGAIGPLPITVASVVGSVFTARFVEPLAPAILAHFGA